MATSSLHDQTGRLPTTPNSASTIADGYGKAIISDVYRDRSVLACLFFGRGRGDEMVQDV